MAGGRFETGGVPEAMVVRWGMQLCEAVRVFEAAGRRHRQDSHVLFTDDYRVSSWVDG